MFQNRAKLRRRGFTIVEMMVGLTLLGVFMSGILGSVRMSTFLAESTIYESTADSVAQGYLEQIKALPYEDLLLAIQDSTNYKVETISPSYDVNQKVTVFNQPLTLETNKQPNSRSVVIDVLKDSATNTVIEMPIKLWVTIEDKNSGTSAVNALEIKIKYSYQLPQVMGGKWMENQVQAIRARI